MSKPISYNSAVTFTPVSYTNGTNAFTTSTQYPISNAYADSNSTTYAYLTLPTTANIVCQIYFNFDSSVLSSIPSDATITSVTGKVKYSANNTTRVATVSVQLYSNTTAKGTAITTRTTSAAQYNLTAGTWSVSEIRNMRLLVSATRNNSTSNSARLNFYGADVTVNYTVDGTAYEIIAESTYTGATVSPASQEVMSGESATIAIFPDDINNIVVEDNGTDVTDQLQYVTPTPGTQTFTGIPTTYDNQSSSYYDTYNDTNNSAVNGVYNNLGPTSGLVAQNSSTRACVFSNTGASAISKLVYGFDCSSIPSNATITSVTCIVGASCYSSGQYFATKTLQLYCGNTAKGTAVDITGNGGTAANHTVSGGSWARAELDNIKIVEYIQRTTSNTDQAASFSFWGATLTVNYTLPSDPYYAYTLTNISADHDILVSESIIVPPEEDPTKTYYSLTISSINATTDPGRGTTRVESGTGQTITITPSDPQITLVLDNGVDVSSQLVHHGDVIQDPTVATAQGASYGFTYCGTTGYYTSTNKGVASSAAVSRVTFNLPVRCLITIEYINYAEATYDYGIFGNIDTALSATSGSDTNAKLVCNASTYNQASPQTLTYEMESGTHYIDIKYRKDTYTDSNNDTLQFKIASIEPLEVNDYYTYSLSGIAADHSLVFIFGDVTYYFVTSSTDSNAKLYPDGQMVELPGETYKLTIVPENSGDTITVRDNNTDVTSSIERKEVVIEKGGQQVTVVNYIYHIVNVQTGHTVVVYSATQGNIPYVKINGSWVQLGAIWKKENGVWVEQEPSTDVFDDETIYVKGE